MHLFRPALQARWASALLFFSIASSCFAWGSLGWHEALAHIRKEDAFLAAYITAGFDISPTGSAVRVGSQLEKAGGPEAGTRIPPYEFFAKPKGQSGNYTLVLTFEQSASDDPKTTMWQMTLRKLKPAETAAVAKKL